jgi:hypothetical protein
MRDNHSSCACIAAAAAEAAVRQVDVVLLRRRLAECDLWSSLLLLLKLKLLQGKLCLTVAVVLSLQKQAECGAHLWSSLLRCGCEG